MTDCQKLFFLANRLGLNDKKFVLGWGGGFRKERFNRNGTFLGGCKDGVFEYISMEEERE